MEEKKSEAAVVATKPDDPIFMELVRHSESVRTQLTHRGLVSLMHLLGADTAQMSLHDDGGLHIIIDACDRHYIVWHYPDEHFTVEGYVDTLVADGEKNWTEVNKYDSRHGMQMANGRRRGGCDGSI